MKKDYYFINVENLCECVVNALKEEGQSFLDYYTNIDSESVMDLCEEEGYRIGYQWANDFRTYCNQEDTRIYGNFNNIKVDYELEFKGKYYKDILAKLNNEIDDEETKQFKDWAVDWFFETFGTFGLKYNFGETLTCYFEKEVDEFLNNETA